MTDLATIARPYAEALFETSQGREEQTQQWLDGLKVVAADAAVKSFVLSPKTTFQMVLELIKNILPAAQLDAEAIRFIEVIWTNNRFEALPAIAEQFEELCKAKRGVLKATVYSAFPVEGSALAQLQTSLEKHFNNKLDIQVILAKDLIGGVRVVVGDEVLDFSVKARLETMKQSLIA